MVDVLIFVCLVSVITEITLVHVTVGQNFIQITMTALVCKKNLMVLLPLQCAILTLINTYIQES